MSPPERECYRIDDLTVDVGAVRVMRGDQPLSLPPLSFALLVTLVRQAPDVVTPEALIMAVWPNTAVADETLTQRVKLLRRALGDDAVQPRYVRSVRGHGYQMVSPVVVLPENDETNHPEIPTTDPRRLRRVFALTAIAVVAAATITAVGLHSLRERPLAGHPAVVTGPASDGDLLARAGTYRARHTDNANELAIELYRKVLERSPQHAGALVGLSFGLAQRATKFNREPDHAIRAAEIAQQVLAREPRNANAHHALALALDATGRIGAAIAAYERAFELDPAMVNARASRAHLLQVSGRLAEALRENLAVFEAGAPNAPYLELQIGTTLALMGFATDAETWIGRAVTLRPDNVFAALAFARLRRSEGRLEEAARLAAEAHTRGITRPELWTIRGDAAFHASDLEVAHAHYRAAADVNPRHIRTRVGLLLLERASDEDQAHQARYQSLVASLRESRAAGDAWPTNPYHEALLHANFGQFDAAVEALDVATDFGFRDVGWLLNDPFLEPLRDHPDFVQQVDRLRGTITAERQRVLGAEWLPATLLSPADRAR